MAHGPEGEHSKDHGHGDAGRSGLLAAINKTLSPEFLVTEGQKIADKTAGIGGKGAQAAVDAIESIVPPALTLGHQKVSGGGHGGGHDDHGDHGGAHGGH